MRGGGGYPASPSGAKASPSRGRGDPYEESVPRLVSGLGLRLVPVYCEFLIIFCHINETLTAIKRAMGQLRSQTPVCRLAEGITPVHPIFVQGRRQPWGRQLRQDIL
jgi:hypothetical protein